MASTRVSKQAKTKGAGGARVGAGRKPKGETKAILLKLEYNLIELIDERCSNRTEFITEAIKIHLQR
jgi:hypothetical protein